MKGSKFILNAVRDESGPLIIEMEVPRGILKRKTNL